MNCGEKRANELVGNYSAATFCGRVGFRSRLCDGLGVACSCTFARFYAPLLTFALVAVSAIVLGKTGIAWSLISFVSVAVVLVAAAAGLMWLVGRRWYCPGVCLVVG